MHWEHIKQILEYVVTILAFVGVVLTILIENRNPSKSMAYILILIFLPVAGLIVYYFFGRDYKKKRIFSAKGLMDGRLVRKNIEEANKKQEGYFEMLEKNFGEKVAIAHLLSNGHHLRLTKNNRATLLVNGEKKFPEVLECLRQAKHHIHIEYYIFSFGDIGCQVRDILIEKAKQGVEVRFIYDDLGSSDISSLPEEMSRHGIEVFSFEPVRVNFYLNANYRDHRKIIVIDGLVGFVGGINMDDRYSNGAQSKLYWRDTHVKLEGNIVNSLQFQFLLSYRHCSKKIFPLTDPYFRESVLNEECFIQLVASGPDSPWPAVMQTVLLAISKARSNIRITNPYFIPNEALITALQIAAQSGVEVELILPGKSDSIIVQHATFSYLKTLLAAGIRIYLYQKGFVHAKTIVIDDDFSMVGTVNMDIRSFFLNFEVSSVIFDRPFAARLIDVFEEDKKETIELNYTNWQNRSLPQKFVDSVCRLMTPLL